MTKNDPLLFDSICNGCFPINFRLFSHVVCNSKKNFTGMRSRGCHFSTTVFMAVMCLVGADLPSCERAKCHHCRVDFIAKMCPTTCEPCPKPIPRPSSGRFAQAKRIVLAAAAMTESVGNERSKKLQPLPHRNAIHETAKVSSQSQPPVDPQLISATTQTPQPQAAPTQQYPQLVSPQNLQQSQFQPQPQPQLQHQPQQQSQPQPQLQPPSQSLQRAQYQLQQAPSSQLPAPGIQQPYQMSAPLQQSPAFNPFQPFLSQSFAALSAVTPAPIFNPFTFPTFLPMTFPPITPPPQRGFQPIRFPQAPTLLSPSMQFPNFVQSQLAITQPQIPPPPPPPLSLLGQTPTNRNRYVSQQVQPQSQSQPEQSYFPKQQVQQPNYAQVNYQQQVTVPQPTPQIPQQQQPQLIYQPQPTILNPTQYALNQNAPNAPKTSQPVHFPQPAQVIATQPPLPQPQPIAAPPEASIDASNTHIEKTFYASGKEVPTPIKQCPRQPNWEPCISKELANERFRSCCQRLGEGCAALCNYDATLATIQLGVLTGRCPISKVADMMICASGYEDATPCCQAFNVFEPGFEHCQPYCNPAAGLPQGGMLSEQYKCLGKLSQIQRCFYISQRPIYT
uniref:Domain of unknown function DB domain-containing protein n=1 Tax=Ascaris lumbricoides TaxID=6252 RepID=A0A9J2P237_ASCLU